MSFAQGPRPAHIGYIYPAGGRLGTTVEVLVGGQALNGIDNVLITGEGVHVKILKTYPPARPLDREQRNELVEKLWALEQKRLAEMPDGEQVREKLIEFGRKNGQVPPRILQAMAGQNAPAMRAAGRNQPNARPTPAAGNNPQLRNAIGARRQQRQQQAARAAAPARNQKPDPAKLYATPTPVPTPTEPIPEHPLLRNLESKSLRQLQEVACEFLTNVRRQPNIQLSDTVLLEITIDKNAAPGPRQIRLSAPNGLTNPLAFQVGTWPECREQEPNDPGEYTMLPPEPAVGVPFVLNGQVKPGDVDRFRFFAQKGQQIVIQAHARELMPYLADAVPGWFQATMSLYDGQGREVAQGDDYQFNPDPVLFYKIAADGEYELEIRDSIYRGREDFVYRINVGEQPFITSMFPLGGRQGADTVATVTGWNLDDTKVRLDTSTPGLHEAVMRGKRGRSNQIAYHVGSASECMEAEPNDSPEKAQSIKLPMTINGRISEPGDVDVYQFSGRTGDKVVADVIGRRLESPIDSLVRLIDIEGKIVAWNDDTPDRAQGLKTHFADSYVMATLPHNGDYFVQISDAQRQGGDPYVYRLRIEPPRPDFELRITPASLNLNPGRPGIFTAYVMRRDGFDGDVDFVLKTAPEGFTLSGGRIPRGKDRIRMTVTAPPSIQNMPASLEFEGRAIVDGQVISRPAVPADDMEQAFAYHHLVPSRDLIATTRGGQRPPIRIDVPGPIPVKIPAGGTVQFKLSVPPKLVQQGVALELNEPPAGIKIDSFNSIGGGVMLVSVKADITKEGLADNLILEFFTEVAARQQGPAKPPVKTAAAASKPGTTQAPAPAAPVQKRRVSAGLLPAIPFVVVRY